MNTPSDKRFTLKKEHKILLSRMHVGWQDCESGAPEIDPKRPYGNSCVEQDVLIILNIKPKGKKEEGGFQPYSEEQKEWARKLHRETEIALQLLLLGYTKIGKYYQYDLYGTRAWKPVKKNSPEV